MAISRPKHSSIPYRKTSCQRATSLLDNIRPHLFISLFINSSLRIFSVTPFLISLLQERPPKPPCSSGGIISINEDVVYPLTDNYAPFRIQTGWLQNFSHQSFLEHNRRIYPSHRSTTHGERPVGANNTKVSS